MSFLSTTNWLSVPPAHTQQVFLRYKWQFGKSCNFCWLKKKKSYQLWKKLPTLKNTPKVTKFWKRTLTKKGSVICYANITQLLRAAPVVWYSPVTFSEKKSYQLWKKLQSFENAPKVTKFWKHTLTEKRLRYFLGHLAYHHHL